MGVVIFFSFLNVNLAANPVGLKYGVYHRTDPVGNVKAYT
jgi:hypothetical protein